MIEIEAKIKLNSREELISRLPALKSKSKEHLFDIYFDKEGELKRAGTVLRLRKQNDKSFITYKGPLIKDSNLLVREEKETETASFEMTQSIIEGIGFRPIQIVEKTRESFDLNGYDVKIELDHYPFIGFYLEIEGDRDKVIYIMKSCGFTMEDAIAKNCTTLFYEHLKNERIDLENPQLQFTFAGEV